MELCTIGLGGGRGRGQSFKPDEVSASDALTVGADEHEWSNADYATKKAIAYKIALHSLSVEK